MDEMNWILACDVACAIGRLKESDSDNIILPDRTIKYPELFSNINPEFELRHVHYNKDDENATSMLSLMYVMPKDGHPRYAKRTLITVSTEEFNLSTIVDILATAMTLYYQKRLSKK